MIKLLSPQQPCFQRNCIHQQESPPAWTQEAYRLPCSKCSLCCSKGGTPSQVWGGLPHPMVGGTPLPHPRSKGVPHPRVGVPHPRSRDPIPGWRGVPSHVLMWSVPWVPPPSRPSQGGTPGTTPSSPPGWGTPHHPDLDRMRYAPEWSTPWEWSTTWEWSTPWEWGTAPRMGYPLTWDGVPP